MNDSGLGATCRYCMFALAGSSLDLLDRHGVAHYWSLRELSVLASLLHCALHTVGELAELAACLISQSLGSAIGMHTAGH
eukprot:6595068-Lingulodinium_polyedra.AAC.1